MLQRDVQSILHEDNESTIAVINHGYSPKLKHLAKHLSIRRGLVQELCEHEVVDAVHVETNKQKGKTY